MKTSEVIPTLRASGACSDALYWLEARGESSWQSSWDECPRGDWLMWLEGRLAWRAHNDDPWGTLEHRRLAACLVELFLLLTRPTLPDAHPEADAALALLERSAGGENVDREAMRSAGAGAGAGAWRRSTEGGGRRGSRLGPWTTRRRIPGRRLRLCASRSGQARHHRGRGEGREQP